MSEIAIKTEKFDEQDELEEPDREVAEEVFGDSRSSQPSARRAQAAVRQQVGRPAKPAAAVAAAKRYPMDRNAAQGRQHPSSTPNASISTAVKPTLPKARCGEVFVSSNARQWTFICTYCNKSTRDIGEFICHIRMKHLAGYYDDDEEDDGDSEDMQNSKTDTFETDQDYLDCGNYLDVNVHTESEDISYNGQEQTYNRVPPLAKLPPLQPIAVKRALPVQKPPAEPNRSILLSRLNATNDDAETTIGRHSKQHPAATIATNVASGVKSVIIRSSYAKSKQSTPLNGDASQRITDCDDADYSQATEEMDVHNPFAPYEDDEDEDFDNQLLITPNDSLDASAVGGSEIKTKRRQIRGTAYCALCNRTFQYYSLYRNHMIKHSNETPFKCPQCKKGFKSKQAIRYHMNTHKKEKGFKCSLCDNAYCNENQFITHVLTHENESTFPCMVCGIILNSNKERDAHVAGHSEERPFRCEFCNKLFRLRHHLSNHLKMHRQYRCDYCKEEFTSAVHQRKPYACPVCEQLPEARLQAANAAVNPLQIYETILPTSQHDGNDAVEMVSDSEDEQEREPADEDDDEEEEAEAEAEDDGDELEDDEDDRGSYERMPGGDETQYSAHVRSKKRYGCKYCHRTYSHLSGLNYHVRNKH